MLPNNFDFAMIPTGSNGKADFTLKEVGMLASTIESIDYSLVSWIKEDLKLSVRTNEGFTEVPVVWQAPERAYQIKHNKDLRDDAGALKLPLISIERTAIVKDPARKGGYQANLYSGKGDGRTGRMIIAKRILQDKTRNFAVASGTRMYTAGTTVNPSSGTKQRYYPRINKKVVIQTLSVPIPVYINAEYKISIRSEYQQQMNTLMTPFLGRTGQINSFILKRNGHLYEAFIDQNFSHSNTVAALGEEMRMFTTEVTIRVLGYLMGEGEDDDRPIVTMKENAVEITFPREGIADPVIPP
jgi:hypothetical protein